MLRSFAIALGAVAALAAAHPAEAAGGRNEARSAGKAPRAAVRATSGRAAVRPELARGAVTASRRPVALPSGGARRMVAVAPRGRPASARGQRAAVIRYTGRQVFAVRGASREASLRYVDRRPAGFQGNRNGLRFVGMFSASPAAAASLPARGGKYGKASYTSARDDGADEGRSYGRMGTWHAGLPAADGEQMDCPTGTMAVLARGHSDTFRCMPM